MNSFPLIRKSGSNETGMSNLFKVTLLFQLPLWIAKPDRILQFIPVLAAGLLLDTVFNFIRFKKPVCSVSAAVTASILQILTPSIPLWGHLAGITAALTLGKHIWGGTGRNVFNPALLGVFFLCFFYKTDLPLFTFSFWTVIATLLALVFLRYRPYASSGWITGMITALLLHNNLTPEIAVSYGVIVFGALIITDPVTVTAKPLTGLISGLVLGFFSLFFQSELLYVCGAVLIFNLISFISDRIPGFSDIKVPSRLKIKPPVAFQTGNDILDLTQNISSKADNSPVPDDPLKILSLIRDNQVFGCGGGGFPTSVKIETVLNADSTEKYFIINGVECDPGLIHDKIIIQKYPDRISRGIDIVSRIVPFKKIVLAVKHKPVTILLPGDVEIFKTPSFYPAGFEKELIRQTLNLTISPGVIPAQKGILVLNLQTVLAIADAVIDSKNAQTKIITVANLKQKQNKAVRVKLGDRITDIIQKVYPGGYPVFYGGGILLCRQADDESVVDSKTSFIAVSDFARYKESPQCSHCGSCIQYCPEKLEVNRIADLIDRQKYLSSKRFNPQRCISCGICSYICPAGRNLMKRVRIAVDSVQKY